MKKIILYAISKCPLGSSDEEFSKHLCTIVSDKKHIGEYLINKAVVENYSHYLLWIDQHYKEKKDCPELRQVYISTVLADTDVFDNYCVKKQIYTPDKIASIFRIVNGCIPVGANYEYEVETDLINNYLEDLFKVLKKPDDSEKEEQ